MKILAVETASAWQSIAILDGDKVLARSDHNAAGLHGTLLVPAIDRVLTMGRLQLGDLDGLACSVGPGSFTGIRVGLAACLGLRAATDLPLVLVPTLEAMAWNVKSDGLPICPVLMSRRGEVYWAIFRQTLGGSLHRIVAEHVGTPVALAQSLPARTLVFGEGWSSMEPQFRAVFSDAVVVSVGSDEAAKPSAVNVAFLGMRKLQQGEIAGDRIEPLYVQRAEAELRFEQSGGVSPVARRQERVAKKISERLARGRRNAGRTIQSRRAHGS